MMSDCQITDGPGPDISSPIIVLGQLSVNFLIEEF